MIRNENEYREATSRLQGERERARALQKRFKIEGKSTVEIKRLTEPMESFSLQLAEEVESYERLKRGQFSELENLHGDVVMSMILCTGGIRASARTLGCQV